MPEIQGRWLPNIEGPSASADESALHMSSTGIEESVT